MLQMNGKEFIQYVSFWFLVILLIGSLLTGCAKTTPVTTTVGDSAKTTVSTIVKNKPECKDVGEACNSQIDAVVATCEQEMKLKIKETRERSLKEGAGFATIGMILLWIVMKRLFK